MIDAISLAQKLVRLPSLNPPGDEKARDRKSVV